ncbi:MAG: saccharopine dehydrogenase NADP-binding domain-containing protein, partial [Microbacterium sp.]|nr:saccharopine dehydrogenase NADP-binding domain-containing protein [Microbacterium sp.]
MSDKRPVVVYGVSGYTGRLVCEYLRELGVPFIAAGRDKAKVEEVVSRIPGIETADYEIVEAEATTEALRELFRGAKVVCNTAGPFIKFGPAVVEAALAEGLHYTDTTGEQDWVRHARDTWGDAFAEKGLLLSPGIAHMYTTSEIAANIALEGGGYDTLDILVLWKGLPTYASTQTIFTILKADWYYLEENKLVEWDHTARFDVAVPGYHEFGVAVPWGGMSHPIWFQHDPRVGNVRAIGGVFNRAVMDNVAATVQMFEEQIRP